MSLGNESGVLKVDSEFYCCCSITRTRFDVDQKSIIQNLNFFFNIATSLTATLGNLLVLYSIWRTPSLHTASNLLLVGLALSDLSVGVVAQPIFITYSIARIKRRAGLFCRTTVAYIIANYCLCTISFLTVTAISLDRYIALHLHLRYNEIVTVKRVTSLLIFIWLSGISYGASFLWSPTFVEYFSIVIIAVGLFTSTFVYFKIYRVIRRHQAQIHAQVQVQVGQEEGNSLNMAQYKKTFLNMLLIYGIFLFCYLPYLVVRAVVVNTGLTPYTQSILEFTLVLLLLNSSLNPFIYCWRFQQIRSTVKETIRKMCCKFFFQ